MELNNELTLEQFEKIVRQSTISSDQKINTKKSIADDSENNYDFTKLIDTYEKPDKWKNLNFQEKLKFNSSKNIDLKAAFSDKFNAKKILEKISIPNLYYAQIVTHVKAQGLPPNYSYYVPIDHEFYPQELKVDKLIKFLEFYNITKKEDINNIIGKTGIIETQNQKRLINNYIIKMNIGWNSYICVLSNKINKIQYRSKSIEPYFTNYISWKDNLFARFKNNPFSKFREPIIFAEEFIGNNLNVYEIYCVQGKPVILCLYSENQDVKIENNFYIKDIEKKDCVIPIPYRVKSKTEHKSMDCDLKLFKNLFLMSKTLSKMFEFVRLDFYFVRNKIYFSEFSFSPYEHKLNKEKWGLVGQILNKEWLD